MLLPAFKFIHKTVLTGESWYVLHTDCTFELGRLFIPLLFDEDTGYPVLLKNNSF